MALQNLPIFFNNILMSGKSSKISWISTSGGAILEFMADMWLSFFVALERSADKFPEAH